MGRLPTHTARAAIHTRWPGLIVWDGPSLGLMYPFGEDIYFTSERASFLSFRCFIELGFNVWTVAL